MSPAAIKLELVPGHAYRAGMSECPVAIRISVTEPLEVAAAIYVTAATLDLVDDEDVSFGFISSVMADLGPSIVLRPEAPYEFVCDVLKDDVDEDKESLAAGKYVVRIDVAVHKKGGAKPQMVVLRGELPLDVVA